MIVRRAAAHLPDHPNFKNQAGVAPTLPVLREIYNGTIIVNGGYGKEQGDDAIAKDQADLVAYGVPYLANPDLAERFKMDAPLNAPDMDTFYGGDEKGYTDYPFMNGTH